MKPARRSRIVLGIDEFLPARVAASVLRNQDCELFALHLRIDLEKLGLDESLFPSALRRSDLPAIEKYCDSLGVLLRTVDVTEKVLAEVYDPFWHATLLGRPDVPSARWVGRVLLPELRALATSVGADSIATGHFARATSGLRQYDEPRLDQAAHFALATNDGNDRAFAGLLLPLGEVTPEMVVRLGREIGAVPAEKEDEAEPLAPIETLLAARASRGQWRWTPEQLADPRVQERAAGDYFKPGPVRGTDELSLGEHPGLPFLAIGDAYPESNGQHILELQSHGRTLVIGAPERLGREEAVLREVTWFDPTGGADYRERRIEVEVLGRLASVTPANAATRAEGRLLEFPERLARLRLDRPLHFTPGMRLLFLEESRLLGAGWIVETGKGD